MCHALLRRQLLLPQSLTTSCSACSTAGGARKVREESTDEEEVGFVPHNRGNKLKRRANTITGGCRLIPSDNAPKDSHHHHLQDEQAMEDEIRANFRRSLASTPTQGHVYTNPSLSSAKVAAINRREIIRINHHLHRHHNTAMAPPSTGPGGYMGSDSMTNQDESGCFGDDADENPYADIKVNEILSPLETSTEILQRPQLRKIFHSPQLQIMAVHAMAMIEREKSINKIMSRMALILQGDDPLYPELGYGLGESCSAAWMGKPDDEGLVRQNQDWKKRGEDQEQVKKTLALLLENINCSNQYIELLSQSRDSVNHVQKQKRVLWKKLKEKREKEIRRRLLSKGHKGSLQQTNASGSASGQANAGSGQTHHYRDRNAS
ncbi:hypothetical protein BGW38_009963 [Lunasporangiospora selenospora]|uniref:Transcriptional regulatory protein RXT2 N-terminal domain-containing protein n=1 Tax=Lunasporangiospora selenospora TaxID=979761 RepID=A0A9P6FXJ2_9FUNG|nr:hypothetical protein BGW38_009963 [Lunasporangiospora selenospora]